MQIDAHIHHYPPEICKNPSAWADAHQELYWKSLVTDTEQNKSLQAWASTEKLLADMDAAQVDYAILLGWYWEHPQSCTFQNQWHAQCVKENPQRLKAFASVQPATGKQALEDLEKAVDQGLCGIGEVFPQAQGFSMQDPTWLSIVEWAIEQDLPINMHVTEPVGHDYAGKTHCSFQDYEWLAKTYPELKLILAHWGGGLAFYELNSSFAKTCKNVYYDTAATPLLYKPNIYKIAAEIVGADKILFGSDYPLKAYPKDPNAPNFTRPIEEVLSSGLDKESTDKILGNNAQKLFS